jgi:hypothetical protein
MLAEINACSAAVTMLGSSPPLILMVGRLRGAPAALPPSRQPFWLAK